MYYFGRKKKRDDPLKLHTKISS